MDGRDGIEFGDSDRDFVIERHMRTQEVVMSDDKSCESNGTIGRFKARRRADVEFKSAVESFNDLFESPELGGDFIEILEADDLFESDLVIFVAFFVEEHDAGSIGRVGVSDEGEFLVGIGGTDGFVHGDDGGESLAVIRDVVGGNGVFL